LKEFTGVLNVKLLKVGYPPITVEEVQFIAKKILSQLNHVTGMKRAYARTAGYFKAMYRWNNQCDFLYPKDKVNKTITALRSDWFLTGYTMYNNLTEAFIKEASQITVRIWQCFV
jgi:hypothetical protein